MNKIQLHIGDIPGKIRLASVSIPDLNTQLILAICSDMVASDTRGFYDIQPHQILVDKANFDRVKSIRDSASVEIEQIENGLQLSCTCRNSSKSLCAHQAQVLFNIMNRDELRVFFDEDLRLQKLKEYAAQVVISSNENPESFFQVDYQHGRLSIVSIQKELLLIDPISQNQINQKLLIESETIKTEDKIKQHILVFRKHRFYEMLSFFWFV